jgi:integrase
METLRLLLDYCGQEPNPARDRRVKLPRVENEKPIPPTGGQFLAILDRVPPRWTVLLILLEQTGIRIGEAVSLAWGDVDLAECRLLVRKSKTRTPRWVQVPGWLMDELAAGCPFEDRTAARRVFPRLTAGGCRGAMARACKQAGIPVFSPHDLRHRRITIWHHDGIPARALAERVGHSQATTTLNVYSHVMPPGEVPAGELRRRVAVVSRWCPEAAA